jgi:hypothetical protein
MNGYYMEISDQLFPHKAKWRSMAAERGVSFNVMSWMKLLWSSNLFYGDPCSEH